MSDSLKSYTIPKMEYEDGPAIPDTVVVVLNGMSVLVMRSAVDGKPSVQIYTEDAEEQDIRIILNDGDIWDQSCEEPWKNGEVL